MVCLWVVQVAVLAETTADLTLTELIQLLDEEAAAAEAKAMTKAMTKAIAKTHKDAKTTLGDSEVRDPEVSWPSDSTRSVQGWASFRGGWLCQSGLQYLSLVLCAVCESDLASLPILWCSASSSRRAAWPSRRRVATTMVRRAGLCHISMLSLGM